MNCEERICELEQELRELKDAWEADVEHYEERISNLEDDCRELRDQRDEWRDYAAEHQNRELIALEERDEALARARELEEELSHVKFKYEALLAILQEELVHLETLITNADWERAVQQIAHIRKRYHAAIAIHALQNPNTT